LQKGQLVEQFRNEAVWRPNGNVYKLGQDAADVKLRRQIKKLEKENRKQF
jgi:hypothetical protein